MIDEHLFCICSNPREILHFICGVFTVLYATDVHSVQMVSWSQYDPCSESHSILSLTNMYQVKLYHHQHCISNDLKFEWEN